MAVKSPQETSPLPDLQDINTDDLVYSLEVKLIAGNKNWLMTQDLVRPAMEYHDPAAGWEVRAIVEKIKARLHTMTPDDLVNLKNTLKSPILKAVKDLNVQRQTDLAATYRSLDPQALQKKKEEVEYVISIDRGVDEILKTIDETGKTGSIRENIHEGITKIKPSHD
jgi:hypothetical protein